MTLYPDGQDYVGHEHRPADLSPLFVVMAGFGAGLAIVIAIAMCRQRWQERRIARQIRETKVEKGK